MKITQDDMDKIIIAVDKTSNGHVWIDGLMGGAIERTDAGNYYYYYNVENAKKHYCKKYYEYCKNLYKGV